MCFCLCTPINIWNGFSYFVLVLYSYRMELQSVWHAVFDVCVCRRSWLHRGCEYLLVLAARLRILVVVVVIATIIITVIITFTVSIVVIVIFVAKRHKRTLKCFKLQTIHSKITNDWMNWCKKEPVKKYFYVHTAHFHRMCWGFVIFHGYLTCCTLAVSTSFNQYAQHFEMLLAD